jgi:carboxyl-terminal processing protease
MKTEAPKPPPVTRDGYLAVGRKKVTLKQIRNVILGMALIILGFGLGNSYRDWRNTLWYQLLPSMTQGKIGVNRGSLSREEMDFSLFWQVWDTLHASYIDTDKLDSEAMVYGAIEGMTAALGDPYTVFLPPVKNQQVKEDLNGEFDGVGIQLGYKRDTLAVMAPLDGHPAIKKGVKAGDLILNIKDEGKGIDTDTMGLTLQEAVTMIRGKKGTEVILTLYREEEGTFEVAIERDTIVIPSVELEFGRVVDGEWEETDEQTAKVAWLKLRRFGENTEDEWGALVNTILRVKANNSGFEGIILDVRNNPGGYLNGAVALASDFIPEGLIVEQSGRIESREYTVNKRGRLLNVPVVVVINGGSASASEILAGALRDRLGVTLIGEQSFGKGTVQEAIELTEEAGLHVTTSRWLLPSGDWIHDDGLKPDREVVIEVEDASVSGELRDTQLIEAVRELEAN